jgi:dTDP-glucose 4,6-dehydratase
VLKDEPKTINEKTNIDVVRFILKSLNKSENLIKYVTDRAGHDLRYAIDPSKIKKELGWQPKTKFEEGVELTIKWYLENKSWVISVLSGEYLSFFEKNYELKK